MSDSLELNYRSHGDADAPPVVLIHAIGTSMAIWAPQIPDLSIDYRVLSVDLRGHGSSPVTPGPYTIGGLASDVLRLLDDLGLERASVVGLSLGGMVGLWLAADAPDRIERLVAACVVPVPPSPTAWHERGLTVLAGGTPAVSDLVVERWGYTARAPEIAQMVREMLATTSAEGYAGCCEAIATMDLRLSLGRIRSPTILLAGADDPAAPPAVAEQMASVMPDARVEVVAGAAHLLNVEAAAATTNAILAHLRS